MSRIIIWTIVGIVVVAGVIFIVTAQKQKKELVGGPVTDKAYEHFLSNYENYFKEDAKDIADIKTKITKPTPQQTTMIASLDTKLAEYRAALDGMKNITGETERVDAMKKIRGMRKEIRNILRQLRYGK